MKTGL